jgi:hypothetical protein
MAEIQKLSLPPASERIPIAFQLGDRLIDGATVQPLSFARFAEYVGEAQGMRTPKLFEARLRRLRMARQVAYSINGATVPLSVEEVLQLPIPAARAIAARLDEGEGKAGKVTREGDGIDKSIVYELGAAIPLGAGKDPITELEFQASVFGDIEDVMAAPDSIQQTALLIATIAKPLGTSLTLLPSWALERITVADGVTIAREVLPAFLGSPDA